MGDILLAGGGGGSCGITFVYWPAQEDTCLLPCLCECVYIAPGEVCASATGARRKRCFCQLGDEVPADPSHLRFHPFFPPKL